MEKLVYVDDALPGITRRRVGKGWAYYDPAGVLIRDAREKKRLNAIALPPAYKDAWFCPAPNGHILATGYDDAGRKQYRYHPDFRVQRESAKYDACAGFGKLLPLVRQRVEGDLGARGVPRERALAAVVRLLDLSAIRIGNEQYAKSNDSYGATTLRADHAEVGRRRLKLHFVGKGGKEHDLAVEDADLAAAVRRMEDLADADQGGDDHLFRYEDDEGEVHPVTSADVNAYLRETMGEDFSAKHFRTFHASSLAFEKLVQGPGIIKLKEMLEHVAEHLGNTPAIARKSYIHPALIQRIEGQEEWRSGLKLPRQTRWLSRAERGLIAFLEECGAASDYLGGEAD
ncbi:DNA topoisomerase IB [Erythrobacter sp. WG]|uniref:DNA topoisomerase IB n=1 Tax=Erythrobacter sp. WG TaxID=2985510 RepID=UPI00226D7944|nr:DNA topoisomerase IB [Erythrobacter sp. WG]MCX9148008.1 DNA topoisomerase IB [Erythrobacter sp. WG]